MKNKDDVTHAAVNLLHNVYHDDIMAVVSIANADCEYRETGCTKHIVQYLKDTRDFIDKLIEELEEQI